MLPGRPCRGPLHDTRRPNEAHLLDERFGDLTLDVDDVANFCGDTLHTQVERTFAGGVRSGFPSFGVHAHDAVFGDERDPPPLPRNIAKADPQKTPPAAPRSQRKASKDDLSG